MPIIYAVHGGRADAREGRPVYFATIFSKPDERKRLLHESVRAVARLMCLAAAMDALYQLLVFGRIYLVKLIVVVLVLAFLPTCFSGVPPIGWSGVGSRERCV
jgi:hypothetical protein